ncbi:DNA primase [Moraxella bovis]|uniref:DNA primase n=1 Tax=Moraxella bovis TaxID=476 RepID=A0A378PZV0_MORBO|nr:CHC2 zinc finger domain-containing protein [Moraxella bovis]STY93945.1 DNA primase [Moraxella bovis]
MRIPDTTLERLNSSADLVAIIKKHTTLKPAGREFKGCCPFHGEKNPSFYVNPQTNLYYCFGCGVKGNPITFLREFKRMTFKEAVDYLSEQTGIELPKDDKFAQKIRYAKNKTPNPSSQTPTKTNQGNTDSTNTHTTNQSTHHDNTTPSANDDYPDFADNFNDSYGNDFDADFNTDFDSSFNGGYNDSYNNLPYQADNTFNSTNPSYQPPQNGEGDLYTLLSAIAQFYQNMLHQNPTAKAYFVSRGLSDETIATFGLGYAPSGWQHLEQAFPHDIEGLRILGLVRTSQKGRDFDLLRDRVIFPIKDRQGRVVGFAGRSLGDEMPKYINSSESPVFSKQHILYGLYEARQAKAANYLMVEGYMDVIALHQAGIYGAVAPMGTAANDKQIAGLLKYNDTLTLCFDGDTAGQRAAWRTLEVAMPVLPDGKTLKFLTLPDGHDPDTYINAHGADAMRAQITHAQSMADYIHGVLQNRYDLSLPENKARAVAELKELTAKLPKGSSFRWWLNNDFWARLSGKNHKQTARDTANYHQETDSSTQLYLCLLYAPHIIKDNPLTTLLTNSGVADAHKPYLTHLEHQGLSVPALPNWQDIDTDLAELVGAIDMILGMADTGVIAQFDLHDKSAPAIDGKAHLIMASLPNVELQHHLSRLWREFFYLNQHHYLEQMALLFNELLCQRLQDVLKKQGENVKNIVLSEIYKRRLQALITWDSQHTKADVATLIEKGF